MTSPQELRIISLLPGATELVAALGLTNQLVGRSHECDYPPQVRQLPACTEARLNSEKPSAAINTDVQQLVENALSIYQVKTDLLQQLQPTHILTQDQCDVCAVSVGDVENAISQLTHLQPQIISLQPNNLEEVWDDLERVAKILEVPFSSTLAQLQGRVALCQQTTQVLEPQQRPTVAALEWTDPLMGAGNWIPELIGLAGGKPLFAEVGKHSPVIQWEDLKQADPDIIVIMPCGFDLERTMKESMVLTQNPGWSDLKAVQKQQVYVTDGNAYFNRPGPRLVDSLEMLAEIVHPELFQFGYVGTGWEYFS
ncbi:cobalamin-binding protein [Spirulina sp. CS-785/01]|uniref:cobalamin-binding protein n=1 Tax=Spirulina sp. CS-785/01 TaxID=3021716 RepID=UPI00232ED87B|nr:cobalamin-binding protein [Spirulina sp. CS-785/01]MDB9313158.1 cobalamin-binding protein [Spirulina sp. CS-785/01]